MEDEPEPTTQPEDEVVAESEPFSQDLNPLILYPNPIQSGTLYLSGKMDVVVLDLNGRALMSAKSVDRMDVSSLKTGTYILKNGKSQISRFVIN